MFNPNRLKVQLKLSINRLKMLQAKKASLNQHLRREIATLLDKGKVESARIRVEHIIREDLLMEAMEMLELYCDLLLARFGLIEQYKTCDPGILEAVVTLIWASPRTDEVKELVAIRDQFAGKYGKEFVVNALDNTDEMVNPRVVQKLQVSGPDPYLVERYLEEIARSYDVPWASDILVAEETSENDDNDDGSGGGGRVEEQPLEPPLLANPVPEATLGTPKDGIVASPPEKPPSPTLDLPEIPSNLPPLKKPTSSPASQKSPSTSKNADDFDSLAKRLEALKRR